ncbi:GH20407 [Drosophila grimshawi]|uniref:Midasin n=1 Tax=Drosophila grimshawi TaxID=7222 RepID=B4J9V2_DROGR|nr:GH20407 [Drosophila grimshawi]
MDVKINKLRRSVQQLLQLTASEPQDDVFVLNLQKFLKKKRYVEQDVERLFNSLSQQLTMPGYTVPLAMSFEEELLLLLTMSLRWDPAVHADQYKSECIALAKLLHLSVDAKRFAKSYFRYRPAPFEKQQSNEHVQIPSKRTKKTHTNGVLETKKQQLDLELVKCCYQLLSSDAVYYRELWDWSQFLANYSDNSVKCQLSQLYCNHIMAMLTDMSSTQLHTLNAQIPVKVQLQFDEHQTLATHTKFDYSSDLPEQHLTLKLEKANQSVTNIEGVILPIFNKDNQTFYADTDGCYDRIVKVDSSIVNLRSIALGVAAAKPICLSGPVGCGKTTLIEYLARKTGRICPKPKEIEIRDKAKREAEEDDELLKPKRKQKAIKNAGEKRKIADVPMEDLMVLEDGDGLAQRNGFLRIQLGDQTDSKMLLGQYRCTDVPGEFVWLPGVLTQAVMHGYWLLLEDLDAATQDTYTILSSLLERNYLSVPGFRDCVKIEPGFQLFVTVRTNKSSNNYSQKSLFSLLEKYLYTINILPLSRNELCKVVSTNYERLATVANRIVDVFLTFSSGDHMSADNLRQQESSDKADTTEKYVALPFEQVASTGIPNSGRLVSTRDLSKEKTALITNIGAKLGIIRSRCEHFANEYKPDVEFGKQSFKIGRATLPTISVEEEKAQSASKRQKLTLQTQKTISKSSVKRATFSFTRLASCILERIAVCVSHSEPVLLVGETGVGKTSSVQYLAERTEHKLVAINMNNQSDVSDLVGGFKPVELNYVLAPLRYEFEHLFGETFNADKNLQFLRIFATHFNNGRHSVIIRTMLNVSNSILCKEEHKLNPLLPRWRTLHEKLQRLQTQLEKSINISFAFIPGSLVNSISNGDWVLLDEINLASAETLECLSTILEPEGSVVLLERGDFMPVKRHPDFRIFACMNPNTDIGKKDLPVGIRNRFTEFFVDELTTDADLGLLVGDYLANTGIQRKSVHSIVQLYKSLRRLSELQLNDGLGNRPVYSLRTLCRSLRICARNLCGSIERNLYESFCLSFLTQLDPESHQLVLLLIRDALLHNAKVVLNQSLPRLGENYLQFEGYWIQNGSLELQSCAHYILTGSVKKNLQDLARIISIGKLPILLQGPTSAGKTSLIDYVARRSGNRCLRINNHEHTDLQEYIGTYAADVSGKLSFREGVLVQAMRHGYWIILDELNLASTDILEALNRVLDDNRELYIAETQTLVKAHPNFMLFATQNPPGLYGGRKTLSRAFKNRFIELHFADIPRAELEIILEQRCLIPASYSRKMVQCMTQLQQHRKNTSKQVFTLRDLFRWGNRYTLADKALQQDHKYDWNQHLIEEGYLVLSAKVRSSEELQLIEKTLYGNFKKRIDLELLFDIQTKRESSAVSRHILDAIRNFKQRGDIVWTRNMTRMAVLTAKALQFDEPVLLVGLTGCGKTTVCQLLASIAQVRLRILNCHMHTEGADFLGGLRPCRGQQNGEQQAQKLFEWADGPLIYAMLEGSYFMADEISLAEDSVLERLNCILEPERSVLLAEKGGVVEEDVTVSESNLNKDFIVQAKSGFQFLATMNPGGDFGKKELSPALRNRFTEVWCLPSDNKSDLIEIAHNCMQRGSASATSVTSSSSHKIAEYLVEIVLFIRDSNEKFKFSVRDILAWANYMVSNSHLTFAEQAIFGLETIFLDALEMLPHESQTQIEALKCRIIDHAIRQAAVILDEHFELSYVDEKRGQQVQLDEKRFGIRPFFINVNPERLMPANAEFLFDAPTTKQNLFRLLSALSLQKPVLLEGPPGVGKTSIVESIAHAIGYQIVRINLCEHTDLADLFGTDLPAEDNLLERVEAQSQLGSFVWRDGPLLAALKATRTWILLDELNLAPQSVLEGLNAVLDHRGEVYIPELNKSFQLTDSTRIFACQNPLKQGGGRKGLPQSFLNRFNKVYLRKLTTEDLLHVVNVKYASYFDQLNTYFNALLDAEQLPKGNVFDLYNGHSSEIAATEISFDLAMRLVRFSEVLDRGVATMEFGYKGGPYEFNLRDILRWCDLLHNPATGYLMLPGVNNFHGAFHDFLLTLYERMQLVYYQRMRCDQDKLYIRNAFQGVFNCNAEQLNAIAEDVAVYWTADKVYLNDVVLEREPLALGLAAQRQEQAPLLLATQRQQLKQIVETVHMEKPLLLCGATDSGKTKLIDALCVLSNRQCNSDNIDDSVTGSFQQFQCSFTDQCRYLPFFEESQQHSVAEELELFAHRLVALDEIIAKLEQTPLECRVPLFEQLTQNKSQLLLLQTYIKSADSLNTGGSFEWVDSNIVTSLKCGQYILLEHVNLCSSAVLDRLNPVFEPNGSLLIAEKGISAHDSAEVVQRSPNFRAFLTIDPKNGELSRAMRNRCVELSLSMSKDAYSIDDMRAIVHGQGVHHTAAIDCMLSIHRNIAQLTEFNSYTISHLTHFAFLSAAYKRIGYELKRAIYVAAMEVYVYAASMDLMGYGLAYYQNKLREVVLTQTEAYVEGEEEQEDYLNDVILRTDELNALTLIKLQTVTLKLLLQSSTDGELPKAQLISLFQSMSALDLNRLSVNQISRFLIYMLYEMSAFGELHMRHLYMQQYLKAQPELQQLSFSLYDCLMQQGKRFQTSLTNLPWHRKLFPRLRDYATQPPSRDAGPDAALALSASLLAQLLVAQIPKRVVTQLQHMDALQYSQALLDKKITEKYTLRESLEQLTSYVQDTKRPMNVSCKIYAKQFTQFQPYYLDTQITLHEKVSQLQQLLNVVPQYGNMDSKLWLHKWLALQSDEAHKWRAFLRTHITSCQMKQFELNDACICNGELQAALRRLQHQLKEQQQQQPDQDESIFIDIEQVRQKLTASWDGAEDEHLVDLNAGELKSYQLLQAALRDYFMDRALSRTLHPDFDEQVNQLYSEQLLTLNGHMWQCLNTLSSATHGNIMLAWRELSQELHSPAELVSLLQQQLGSSSCYKALRSYQRQFRQALQCYQLENLATRFDCAQVPSDVELGSRYSYQGPALSNALLSLVCQSNGQLLSVPLSELQPWRQTLQQTRQLLWQNAQLQSRRHSPEVNNLQLVQESGRQLLNELEYVTHVQQEQMQQQQQMDAGFERCIQELQQVLQQLQLPQDQTEPLSSSFNAALANTLIGVLELCVLTHAPLIDPVEKNRLKNLYIAEDIDCLVHFSAAHDFMRIIMNYKHFGQQIYEQVQQRLHSAQQQQQQLNQKLALRPDQCLYASLVQDLMHFLKSNCDCAALHKLIKVIRENWSHFLGKQAASEQQLRRGAELLNKLELWLANAQRFVHHTLARYEAYYQDFVLPIKCAVNQMRFGLEQLKQLFSRLLMAGSAVEAIKLEKTIAQIGEFPAQRPLAIRNTHVYGLLAKLPHSEHEYFRLLKAKLTELRNFISIASSIDETIFAAYDDALSICNRTWQQEEQRRNEQRAEEESLYKTKTLGGVEDEELEALQEIEQHFPTNLDEDFAEFVDQPTLEQVLKLDKKAATKAKLAQIVNEQDYVFLARNFIESMTRYTTVSYKDREQQQREKQELQLIQPYQARLQVFVQLHGHYKTAVGATLDDSVYNALTFALAVQQRQLQDIHLEESHSSPTYDFYKDSNITEINGCLDVMERIEKRVLEQLELYPEHAGLADIKLVISRIRKLPANASVVRFNTGFQLLRQKLALWNELAHRNNNLVAEEIEVAEFVQRWTKLELQHWRNCLNQTAQLVELRAYRYWFFIYNLLQGGAADLPESIRTLRQFVEASCYGDFHVRLQLLHGFEMYLHNVERAGKAKMDVPPIIAALHNLQLYFAQFAQEVADTVKLRRVPIEKKLREFVKIQSYNKDLSYFSMRNNVASVHRNLGKFLKEYRLLLEQKISEVFQPKDSTVKDYSMDKSRYKQKFDLYLLDSQHFVAPQQLRDKYSAVDLGSDSGSDSLPLLQQLGKHFGTARNIVRQTLSHTEYGPLLTELDELVTAQLERCEQLRNLNVDRSKERPQQKLQAKQILQQKRKALTDLFKLLTRLGISYKSGLMELSLRGEFENFELAPFCIEAMLPQLHSSGRQFNQQLDLYYMKSVFKLKLLQNIMLTPLSELGPPNIERIKGFAVDLFLHVQQQREQLSTATRQLHELRNALHQLRHVADIVMPTEATIEQLSFSRNADECVQLKHKLCQIQYVLRQWQLLLQCAPLQATNEHSLCGVILSGSQALLFELERASLEFLDSNKLSIYLRSYQTILDNMQKTLAHLNAGHEEHLPLAQPLLALLAQLESNTACDVSSGEPVELNNVDAELANIAHGVLLALQKIYKQHGKQEEKQETEEEDSLKEQHLKQHLTGQLNADWQLLRMPRTLSKLSNVLLVLKHANPSEKQLICLRRAVSAKMLSIMLTAFVEIGSKGFCVPPDLMQDEEGQSKQDSKNGEGFGLEDGTGENDASDKIESEDQLDDAKRPEDRKDEGDKEEPDCKEEKGIEMSDDFDAKMQDVEKPENEEDDSGESEDEDELNKEMGETEEGAEKLDDQIWGDDEEKQPEEEEPDMNEEDQGKGTKDEKDDHNDLDTKNDAAKEDGKDEHEKDALDATSEPSGEDKRKEQAKDIDDMKEPELDEEQTNAMHNELEEPPEPEEMDLGDMNNVDEGHDKDADEPNDENPFDIDAMKENMQAADEPDEADADEEEAKESQPESDDSDSEAEEGGTENETTQNAKDNAEEEEASAEDEKEQEEPETQTRGELNKEEEEQEEPPVEPEAREEKPEEHAQSKDKSSKEDNVQSVPDTEQNSSAEQMQQQQQDENIKQEQKMDEQETGEEKDGVGQAENDTNDGGHQGVAETKETISQEERKNEKQTQEKRKQGRTNEERTLGEAEQTKLKQLKTIDQMKESKQNENEQQDQTDENVEADEYQHVKDPKSSDKTTLDNATEEQSKQIKHQEEEEATEEENADVENADELMADEEPTAHEEEDAQLEQLSCEKTDQKSEKPSKTEQAKERLETPEQMEIEGEVVPTMTVPRSTETTAHSNTELLLDKSTLAQELSTTEQIELRQMYQQQLTSSNAILPHHEDYESWSSISNRMTQNARELCEQLRLILEPTKCTRLKGDYRTGRRINMKKIIPYIASQFRKDKIWLRRTKPAQRDYKITIAIDDSKSMHHNNSKTLTLEAISLVSQALTLLESGRLSIVSFGEAPQIILNHTEQFDGPRLVSALNFAQDKTKIAGLLDFIRTVNIEESGLGGDNGLFENLLLILSDGRNIFSEGNQKVKNAIKLARLQRIFLVYIIIDNPENKNSILDIQHVEVNADGSVKINSYLDSFPFPYYVIVRDLNQLPLVLSEAMRQWFELVNSE